MLHGSGPGPCSDKCWPWCSWTFGHRAGQKPRISTQDPREHWGRGLGCNRKGIQRVRAIVIKPYLVCSPVEKAAVTIQPRFPPSPTMPWWWSVGITIPLELWVHSVSTPVLCLTSGVEVEGRGTLALRQMMVIFLYTYKGGLSTHNPSNAFCFLNSETVT